MAATHRNWNWILNRTRSKDRIQTARRRNSKRLMLESLENRNLLASFAVNVFDDTVDANPGDGLAQDVSGNTSLRAAIMEANALAGDDVINLAPGTYPLTLTGTDEDAAATGDLDIVANGSIVINGAGADSTIIDAGGTAGLGDRVFQVLNDAELSVRHSTITGGSAVGGQEGGAVHVLHGGTLNVENSHVSGNSARGGGGFATLGESTINLTGSTVSGNVAASSGGGFISYDGTVNVIDSTVSNNQAGRGGGIDSGRTAEINVTGSTVSGNVSRYQGGAFANYYGTVNISDSVVTGNSAGQGQSGVLFNEYGPVHITGSHISGNEGGGFHSRGAIRDYYRSVAAVLNLHNSTVSGNSGPTFTIEPETTANVTSSTIKDNLGYKAFQTDAAELNVSHSTISGQSGDGIFSNGGITRVTHSTISGNTGTGLYVSYGEGSVSNSTVSGNGYRGLQNYVGTLNVSNSTIAGNAGGGLYLALAQTTVNNTIISGNAGDVVTGMGIGNLAGSNNLSDDPSFPGSSGAVTDFDPVLRDNGGPTLTHALGSTSNAINAGADALAVDSTGNPLTSDQRGAGFDRIVGGTVDIGAFEFAVSTPDPNAAPIANDDSYTAELFTLLETGGSVLDNDTDADAGDPLSVTTTGVIVTAQGATVTMNVNGTFTYDATSSETLLGLVVGGTANDTFEYTITDGKEKSSAQVTIAVARTGEENSVQVVDGVAGKTLVVIGSSLDDKIDVMLDTQQDRFRVKIKSSSMANSTDMGSFKFAGSTEDVVTTVMIYGLDGDDDIKVHSKLDVVAWLFGGNGDDKLRGGKGHDILVGGDGHDKMEGKDGNDILIGGLGADLIKGDKAEDILIAGSTDHDDRLNALLSIQQEWTSGNSFADRVNNIYDGSGVADGANGTHHLNSDTVKISDGAVDILAGGSGTDWFIADTETDDDKRKDVNDGEDIFGLDADWFNTEP